MVSRIFDRECCRVNFAAFWRLFLVSRETEAVEERISPLRCSLKREQLWSK
jgi:hypothetical protein